MRYVLIAFPAYLAWIFVMAWAYQRYDPWRFHGTWRSLLYMPLGFLYYVFMLLLLVALAIDFPDFFYGAQRSGFVAYVTMGILFLIFVPALVWFGMKYADPKAKKKNLLELAEDFLLLADLLLFYAAYLPSVPHPPSVGETVANQFYVTNPAFTLAAGTFVLFAIGKLALLYSVLVVVIFPKSRFARLLEENASTIEYWRLRLLTPLAFIALVLAIIGHLIQPFL